MDGWVVIPLAGIFLGLVAMILEHREKVLKGRGADTKLQSDYDSLASEYREFVLGVDSRIQKLEERIRLLEARLRQSGDSGESQQVRRG
jgi:hypothetical protein